MKILMMILMKRYEMKPRSKNIYRQNCILSKENGKKKEYQSTRVSIGHSFATTKDKNANYEASAVVVLRNK